MTVVASFVSRAILLTHELSMREHFLGLVFLESPIPAFCATSEVSE
jgi:hypothetical protein